jgi:hypothetical protein
MAARPEARGSAFIAMQRSFRHHPETIIVLRCVVSGLPGVTNSGKLFSV